MEVDAVLETNDGRIAGVEVTASATVTSADFKGLRHLQAQAGDAFATGVVLYTGAESLSFGVLRNRLGITDGELLAVAEADIMRAKLVVLAERPLSGDYDLAHLQAFHRVIFGDIYAWAGQLRTVELSKHTPFCPLVNLRDFADEVFGRLRSADYLRDLSRADFVHQLAELCGDLNAPHPFREGNGRAPFSRS